jgi:hypothetical protein
MKMTFFQIVGLCSLLEIYRHFCRDNGDRKTLWNFREVLQAYTGQHLRTCRSENLKTDFKLSSVKKAP